MEEAPIQLSEYIRHLRAELLAAVTDGDEHEIRFGCSSLELEIKTVAGREKEGGGGLKVWIANLAGKAKVSEQETQTIKMSLVPERNGKPLKLSRK